MKLTLIRSLVAATAIGASAAATADPITIATWNLAWLADNPLTSPEQVKKCQDQDKAGIDLAKRAPEACQKGSPFRLADAYVDLARQVKRLNFDIIGMQELQSQEAAKLILGDRPISPADQKAAVDAGTYKVVVNPDGGWQRVGLAVKTNLLKPGEELIAVPFKEIGAPVTRDHRSALDVSVPLSTGVTLRILVVHLKSSCHRVSLETDTADCKELAAQAPILENWIQKRKEDGKPFLVLGDFNRVLASSMEHEQCKSGAVCKKRSLKSWLDENSADLEPVLIPTADARHVPECGFKKDLTLIDQILLGGTAERAYIAGSVRSHPYFDQENRAVAKEKVRHLSDHCPVSIQLNL